MRSRYPAAVLTMDSRQKIATFLRQIVPTAFFKPAGDEDPEKSRRVLAAMMKMKKMDIARLEEAHRGPS